jgi:hypothetical protein
MPAKAIHHVDLAATFVFDPDGMRTEVFAWPKARDPDWGAGAPRGLSRPRRETDTERRI